MVRLHLVAEGPCSCTSESTCPCCSCLTPARRALFQSSALPSATTRLARHAPLAASASWPVWPPHHSRLCGASPVAVTPFRPPLPLSRAGAAVGRACAGSRPARPALLRRPRPLSLGARRGLPRARWISMTRFSLRVGMPISSPGVAEDGFQASLPSLECYAALSAEVGPCHLAHAPAALSPRIAPMFHGSCP